MKKLSELKNDTVLLVGENLVISKEDYIKEIQEHIGEEVYTTTEYKASINAKDMLDSELENVSQDMYEDWYEGVWQDISDKDIEDLQAIVDKILNKSSNITYYSNEKVDVDIN